MKLILDTLIVTYFCAVYATIMTGLTGSYLDHALSIFVGAFGAVVAALLNEKYTWRLFFMSVATGAFIGWVVFLFITDYELSMNRTLFFSAIGGVAAKKTLELVRDYAPILLKKYVTKKIDKYGDELKAEETKKAKENDTSN